jgi:hypothetical protein
LEYASVVGVEKRHGIELLVLYECGIILIWISKIMTEIISKIVKEKTLLLYKKIISQRGNDDDNNSNNIKNVGR